MLSDCVLVCPGGMQLKITVEDVIYLERHLVVYEWQDDSCEAFLGFVSYFLGFGAFHTADLIMCVG